MVLNNQRAQGVPFGKIRKSLIPIANTKAERNEVYALILIYEEPGRDNSWTISTASLHY